MFKNIILPLGLLVMAVAGLVLAYWAVQPLQLYLFHADALYLPALFRDLFEHGGRLRDWFLTPAPYFFPDFLIYLPAYLLGKGPYEQILLYGLFQAGLTMAAILFLVKEAAATTRLATTVFITVALLWLAVNAAEPFVELLTSAYHFGAFLCAVAFAACWLQRERAHGPARRWLLAAMCVLAFLATLSDNIFLVQVIAPYLATSFLLHERAAGRSRFPGGALLVLLASLLGSLSYRFVVAHRTRYPARLGLEQLAGNVHDLLDLYARLFTAFPLLGAWFCAYVLFACACLIASLRKRTLFQLPRALVLLVVFSLLSMAATTVAVLLVSNLPVAPRYLVPVLFWPLIIGVLLVQHVVGKRFYWISMYGAGVFSMLLLASALRLPIDTTTQPGYYPEQIACIDQVLARHQVRHGIAQYWDAKRIEMFSRQDITLAQYFNDLKPQKWITSERHFRPAYDFAIIAENVAPMFQLPAKALVTMNGEPAEVAVCGDRSVLVFGPGKLRLAKIEGPGSSYVWRGCELSTLVGKQTAACEIEKDDAQREGFLSFGPYEQLPAGRYAFELHYVSSKGAGESAGRWDVELALAAQSKRLQSGTLEGTAGRAGVVRGEFSVPSMYDMEKFEIRTLSSQGGTMKVTSLRLTRLQ